MNKYHVKETESEIKRSILQYLNTRFCTFAFSVPTTGIPDGKGGFRRNPNRGCADIIGVKGSGAKEGGKFFALEVKRPGNKATPNQRSFLENVAIAGGYAAIVYSVDDAMQCWNEI